MKKIAVILLTILCVTTWMSCNQDEFRSFEDYDYTTVYFPYQYPVRTLILGDYSLADNSRDKEFKFLISARIGGVYKNNSDVKIAYQIDESLVDNLLTNPNQWDGKTTTTSDVLAALPSNYYTLGGDGKSFIIPKGSYHGGVEIQLTPAFFDDPLAWKTHYVIPLRITSTSADSVLSGYTVIPNADPRVMNDWDVVPKDFTIFGIKFVNPFHGKYLHKGKSVITMQGSDEIQTITYSAVSPTTGIPTLELNEILTLHTSGKNRVTTTARLRDLVSSPGNFEIYLDFIDGGDDCIVTDTENSKFPVKGSGRYARDTETWGGKTRDAIYLNLEVTNGASTATITDTLVFRDKGINFQEYSPVLDFGD